MKKPFLQIGAGVGLGVVVGAATAVILGSGGAWLAVGIALGIAIGAAMFRRNHGGEVETKRLKAD